jgi:hypothetical protein
VIFWSISHKSIKASVFFSLFCYFTLSFFYALALSRKKQLIGVKNFRFSLVDGDSGY